MRKSVVITIPHLVGWGTEIQTLVLVRALRKIGWSTTICCYFEHDEKTVRAFHDAGAEIILFNMRSSCSILKLIIRIIKLLRDRRPDVVHVQYMIRGFVTVIAARLAAIPHVYATVHHPGRMYGWKQKTLLNLAAYLTTNFFCNSLSVEESWFGNSWLFNPWGNNPMRKHCTIYNAALIKELSDKDQMLGRRALRHSLGLTDRKIIGVIGRLSREKGQETVLHALPEILGKFPDTTLLVVGSGPDLPAAKQLAEELGIVNSVIWLEMVSQEKLNQYYYLSDVVVVPSLLEGFGLVAAEASALGRPVVATDIDGLREVVEAGVSGLLVPQGDIAALAGAIVRILGDDQMAAYLGQNGQKRVKELFSFDRFAECMRAVYGKAN